MSDPDDGVWFILVLATFVAIALGVTGFFTCSNVQDLKQGICAERYHQAATGSDTLRVHRDAHCDLPSATP